MDGEAPQDADLGELVKVAISICRTDPQFAGDDVCVQDGLSRSDVDNPPEGGVLAYIDSVAPSLARELYVGDKDICVVDCREARTCQELGLLRLLLTSDL